MSTQRYVWFFQSTGEFSNSWGDDEHDYLVRDMAKNPDVYQKEIDELGAKLIKYTCINDDDFEIYPSDESCGQTGNHYER